jgi:acetoin utilization deacetylase AcuC-like enzyme
MGKLAGTSAALPGRKTDKTLRHDRGLLAKSPMIIVHSPDQGLHAPTVEVEFGVPVDPWEVPARAERILAALGNRAEFELRTPAPAPRSALTAVHDQRLVGYLENQSEGIKRAGARLGIPDTFLLPAMREGMGESTTPSEPASQLGLWCFDSMTPLEAGTYRAARSAVDVAVSAAEAVLGGATSAYALCRPPGHHAARAMYGGYCYFNNVAIAAAYALERAQRVAILDVDYHHGNGTQQIFYQRGEALYVSLHGHPDRAFPFYTGFAEETGAGDGRRANLNIPLPAQCPDDMYLAAVDRALDQVGAYSPEILLVSLGTDTIQGDPLGDFAVSREAFAGIGSKVGALGLPTIVVQEGGYNVVNIGEDVRSWLSALGAGR